MIRERLHRLRQLMTERGIDAVLIPSSDYHASEYVGEHFKVRQFFSGFSGSAGTLVVTAEDAGLWTDGRYFLRAEQCLMGTGIKLYRMGEPDVPEVNDFLARVLPINGVLSVDGRVISAAAGATLAHSLGAGRTIRFDDDLVTPIWTDRPAMEKAPVFLLPEQYAGASAAEKLKSLRNKMQQLHADAHLISALDQIAWLLNLRGGDVRNNPITLSYLLVERETAILFIDEEKLPQQALDALEALNVKILPYDAVYHSLDRCSGQRVLVDPQRTNYALCRILERNAELILQDSPILHAKARKNSVEQENLRRAHLKDGLAVTRFMHWIKTVIGCEVVTERSAAQRIDALRKQNTGCISPSFGTISAYGDHAADIHYAVTDQSNAVLQPHSFLLVDSGGQYYEGTTDVTRTIALGPLSAEEKKHFTLVLQAMLNLSAAVFPEGCSGYHLDALARAPIWAEGLDYNHGTGHGIGYLLSVHEPLIGFAWRRTERYDTAPLQEGNVISDEPGIYIPGSHGIRLENQLLCRNWEQPGFLCFETLTLAPIDLDAVDPSWLEARGKSALNAYHARVFRELSPYLNEDERIWLRQATRAI